MMFSTLHDASTADLSQVLADVKKYASEVVVQDLGCLGGCCVGHRPKVPLMLTLPHAPSRSHLPGVP